MTENLTKIAAEVAKGLQSQPMLLTLISLNVVMVGGALWFLQALAMAQAARFDTLLKICGGKL